jgi:predicted Fe-Mo cluster-binding NifX family protein
LNAINSGLPSNNKSGVKGVCWHKAGNKWTAQIKNDGVKIHLGSYDKLQDAVGARLKAEEDLWCDIR